MIDFIFDQLDSNTIGDVDGTSKNGRFNFST